MSTTHTNIAWTDRTWSPTRGCRRVSPGCANCYAERTGYRFSQPTKYAAHPPYEGLVALGKTGPRWTGKGLFVEHALAEPFGWRKPARVFVDSMSDLFFEEFSDKQIAAVFGAMALACHHTFQVLTKRADRMRTLLSKLSLEDCIDAITEMNIGPSPRQAKAIHDALPKESPFAPGSNAGLWPLPNVWIGVSVESQQYANERIPELVRTPAAVKFISYEPALERVDFDPPICPDCGRLDTVSSEDGTLFCAECETEMAYGNWLDPLNEGVSWLIVGGESGPGARPFDIDWARSAIHQCRASGAAVFVKQLGAKPCQSVRGEPAQSIEQDHPKGEDPSEWPNDLRVREFPNVGVQQ